MLVYKSPVPTGSSITTVREPRDDLSELGAPPSREKRPYQPPDAAMPGPLARYYPIEEEDLEAGPGGDSFYDGLDAQNQDRI